MPKYGGSLSGSGIHLLVSHFQHILVSFTSKYHVPWLQISVFHSPSFHISYSITSFCQISFQIIALSDKIWNHINPFLGNIAKRGEVLSLVRDVGKVSSGLLSFVTCFQPSWGPIPTFTFHLGFFFTFTFFT